MNTCLIALGSNRGDRRAVLEDAILRLAQHSEIQVAARSQWRETRPIGGPTGQGWFLNGALRLETSLSPPSLLDTLLAIETSLGRHREIRWGPRTIDLDLLLYGDLVLETPELVVPHPRMAWRRFVLEPAAEAGGSLIHPTTGWTVAQLLDHLNTARPYLAIAGPPGAGKSWLAERLVERASAEWVSLPSPLPAGQGSPGSPWDRAIEFLEAMVRLLIADGERRSQSGPLRVSDFWLDQSLAYAEATLDADQQDAFRQRWEAAREQVVQPKLAVLLDPPVVAPENRLQNFPRPLAEEGLLHSSPRPLAGEGQGVRAGGREAAARQAARPQDAFRNAMRRLAREPGHGPVFRLAEGDRQRVLGEVLAALEAMA